MPCPGSALDIDTQREVIGELLTVTLRSPGRAALADLIRHTVEIAWTSEPNERRGPRFHGPL